MQSYRGNGKQYCKQWGGIACSWQENKFGRLTTKTKKQQSTGCKRLVANAMKIHTLRKPWHWQQVLNYLCGMHKITFITIHCRLNAGQACGHMVCILVVLWGKTKPCVRINSFQSILQFPHGLGQWNPFSACDCYQIAWWATLPVLGTHTVAAASTLCSLLQLHTQWCHHMVPNHLVMLVVFEGHRTHGLPHWMFEQDTFYAHLLRSWTNEATSINTRSIIYPHFVLGVWLGYDRLLEAANQPRPTVGL